MLRVEVFVNRFRSELIDVIVGIDARGFILGAALGTTSGFRLCSNS